MRERPRDVATGQASGKSQHGPVTFTKEWGAASPQLFTALVSNEMLKSVLFDHGQLTSPGAVFFGDAGSAERRDLASAT